MTRVYAAIITVAGAATLAFAAPGPTPSPADLSMVGAQEAGKAIFEGKGNCFTCHRKDGKGTPLAPDLTDGTWVQFDGRPSLEAVETLVKDGVSRPKQHPAPMPPMGGASLSEQEIAQVSEYVLSLSAESE